MNDEHLKREAINAQMEVERKVAELAGKYWPKTSQEDYQRGLERGYDIAISAIERSQWVAVETDTPDHSRTVWVTIEEYQRPPRVAQGVYINGWQILTAKVDDPLRDLQRTESVSAWMDTPEPYTPKEQI